VNLKVSRVALVTGSSRGIGRAIALEFARAGGDIVVAYNQRSDSAESVAANIRSLGRRAVCAQLDVSSRLSIQGVVNLAVETFGRIDVLVNNAGIIQQKPFLEVSDEDWGQIMDVNLKGAFLCAQEVFPVMKEQKEGVIINMASSGGQLGGPLALHYSASKAGVICLTKSLARIGGPFGIRVNCISPGLIDTEMTQNEIQSEAGRDKIKQIALQRVGTVEEVARVAVFLASEASEYITGQTVNVNGGLYMG
jgi:3-oxoacyl-[acyl-carrier protein] reductase